MRGAWEDQREGGEDPALLPGGRTAVGRQAKASAERSTVLWGEAQESVTENLPASRFGAFRRCVAEKMVKGFSSRLPVSSAVF